MGAMKKLAIFLLFLPVINGGYEMAVLPGISPVVRSEFVPAIDAYNLTDGVRIEKQSHRGGGFDSGVRMPPNKQTVATASTVIPYDYKLGTDVVIYALFSVGGGTGGDDVYLAVGFDYGETPGQTVSSPYAAYTETVYNDLHYESTHVTEPGSGGVLHDPEPGDFLNIKSQRSGTDPLDTYSGDLVLLGWVLLFTRTQ